MAQPPIITYDAKIISPGYNLHVAASGGSVIATYDDYPTDASGVVAHCSITISYTDVQWTINYDNSITVTGNITGGVLTRTATGVSSSQSQEITAKFNGVQTFNQTVSSAGSGTYNLNIPATFEVTVQPSFNPQPQGPAAIEFKNDNTTSPSAPDEFFVGILITNPNPPDYRPGAVLDGNDVWQSHDRSSGKAHILTSGGSWNQLRTVDGLTACGNPPSIRYDDKWYNQRKFGNI